MELANKEIASIFNISVRGVETARYRLKKKYPGIQELIGS
jgi:DNA-binding CsgD family transcriptional regulator